MLSKFLIGIVALGAFGMAVLTLLVVQSWPFEATERSGPLPGDPWGGDGDWGISQQELEGFDEFSVFWLGPEFGGFHLQAISARPGEVTMAYGTCEGSGGLFRDGGCPVPVSMHIRPACAITPSIMAGGIPGTPEEREGGALMLVVENQLMNQFVLWTDDVFITVHVTNELPVDPAGTPRSGFGPSSTATPPLLHEAVAALKPLGEATRRGLTAMEAPDFTACPQSALQ